MPESGWRLVAGLGNPGPRYANTRHNAGFMVIDQLAADYGISVDRRKFPGLRFGIGTIEDARVILAKPQVFMNNSGPPVRRLADYYSISCSDMLVVHDDVDLAFGRLKITEKGGHAGHKGVQSLMIAFGGNPFPRIRFGVGRPESGKETADYVLTSFGPLEKKALTSAVTLACEAAAAVLLGDIHEAMNRFNRKQTENANKLR